MDYSKLTDFQLYAIIKGDELGVEIKRQATIEMQSRSISFETMEQIIRKYDALYPGAQTDTADPAKPLEDKYKVLLLLLPFAGRFSGAYLMTELQKKGRGKLRKQFLFYYCAGMLLWTILIVLWAKYYLFKQP